MELVSCVSWVRLSVRLRLVPSLHESCLLSRAALDVPTPANANADKTAGTRTSVDLRNRRIPTPPKLANRSAPCTGAHSLFSTTVVPQIKRMGTSLVGLAKHGTPSWANPDACAWGSAEPFPDRPFTSTISATVPCERRGPI